MVNAAAPPALQAAPDGISPDATAASHIRGRGRGWSIVAAGSVLLIPALVLMAQFLKTSGSRAAWVAGAVACAWLAVGLVRRVSDRRLRRRFVVAGVVATIALAAGFKIARGRVVLSLPSYIQTDPKDVHHVLDAVIHRKSLIGQV